MSVTFVFSACFVFVLFSSDCLFRLISGTAGPIFRTSFRDLHWQIADGIRSKLGYFLFIKSHEDELAGAAIAKIKTHFKLEIRLSTKSCNSAICLHLSSQIIG